MGIAKYLCSCCGTGNPVQMLRRCDLLICLGHPCRSPTLSTWISAFTRPPRPLPPLQWQNVSSRISPVITPHTRANPWHTWNTLYNHCLRIVDNDLWCSPFVCAAAQHRQCPLPRLHFPILPRFHFPIFKFPCRPQKHRRPLSPSPRHRCRCRLPSPRRHPCQ